MDGLRFLHVTEPDDAVKRPEASAAARLKMQKERNAQAEKHKETLRHEGLHGVATAPVIPRDLPWIPQVTTQWRKSD